MVNLYLINILWFEKFDFPEGYYNFNNNCLSVVTVYKKVEFLYATNYMDSIESIYSTQLSLENC